MAEMLDSEPLPSSSESPTVSDCKDDDEPSPKKRKLSVDTEHIDKLEHRLGSILCCVVCLDLPQAAVYQCSNGHLMCASCFTHLLADARLRDDNATCPGCRVEISKTSTTRNLAVEKAVSELPSECRHCANAFPRRTLQHHEDKICEDRPTGCRYACVGCGWRGAARAAAEHEAECPLPRRPAADLLQLLARREREHAERLAHHTQLLDLLSYEKITFIGETRPPRGRPSHLPGRGRDRSPTSPRPAAAAVPHRGAPQALLRDVALHGLRAPVGRQGVRQPAPARPHAERAAGDHVPADPEEQAVQRAVRAVGGDTWSGWCGGAPSSVVCSRVPGRRGVSSSCAAAGRPRRRRPPARRQGRALPVDNVPVFQMSERSRGGGAAARGSSFVGCLYLY